MPSRNTEIDPVRTGWRAAERDEETPDVMDLMRKPYWNRPEWEKMLDGKGNGVGMDVFMLVDIDVHALPVPAIRRGLNRLWVRAGKRRPDATHELSMAELELVFSTSGDPALS